MESRVQQNLSVNGNILAWRKWEHRYVAALFVSVSRMLCVAIASTKLVGVIRQFLREEKSWSKQWKLIIYRTQILRSIWMITQTSYSVSCVIAIAIQDPSTRLSHYQHHHVPMHCCMTRFMSLNWTSQSWISTSEKFKARPTTFTFTRNCVCMDVMLVSEQDWAPQKHIRNVDETQHLRICQCMRELLPIPPLGK